MHDKKLYGTATVGTKGQIVIPADAREELGIKTGDRLYVMGTSGKGFIGLIKEDMIESFIEQLNLQLESLKTLKDNKKVK
ncbi:AbrB/MazE/SpoVT family DNA-binding domain-containing protein [Patescibacteria group bacterium]|nr:MAG: AbrB/MazE/SpoVT family DNA-binding domain-containing protein [Patescibacteria group bacterium]